MLQLARQARATAAASLAAGDRLAALKWLDRAQRLMPEDGRLMLERAGLLLGDDAAPAAEILTGLLARWDLAEGWAGLATAHLRLDHPAQAAAALARLLGGHVFRPEWRDLANLVARRAGSGGWCALDGAGRLVGVGLEGASLTLDGRRLRARARLPANWRDAAMLAVRQGESDLLGSPIRIARLARLDGWVAPGPDGKLHGWAWHPGEPDRAPLLRRPGQPDLRLAADAIAPGLLSDTPLARPRGFVLGGRQRVLGPDGADLPGSQPPRPRPPPTRIPPLADIAHHGGSLAAAIRAVGGAAVRRDLLWLPDFAHLAPGAPEALAQAAYASADRGAAQPLAVTIAELALPPPPGRPIALETLDPEGGLYLRHDLVRRLAGAPSALGRLAEAGWRPVAVPTALMALPPPDSPTPDLAASNLPPDPPDAGTILAATLRPALPPATRRRLAQARRSVAEARWRAEAAPEGSVLLICHDQGGGVARAVDDRAAWWRAQRVRPIVLLPTPDRRGCALAESATAVPALTYAIPAELPALLRLLRAGRPNLVELHHRMGHRSEIFDLAAQLGVPQDVWLHDYGGICPRITLIGRDGRYCGAPRRVATCTACIAALGSELGEEISIAALRARTRATARAARAVMVPTADMATRLAPHLPGIVPRIVALDDVAPPAPKPRRDGPALVCVIGAINAEKGADILLGCARDAAARGLALSFVLVGHSSCDADLLATGRVFITGRYRESEAVRLIAAQNADLAFLPSLWPESWCYALSLAWQAGLAAAVFDLGAPAARVRAAGMAGGLLLPVNIKVQNINDMLVYRVGYSPIPYARATSDPASQAGKVPKK